MKRTISIPRQWHDPLLCVLIWAQVLIGLLITISCLSQTPELLFLSSQPITTTPPSSLVTNLVSYWHLDETSGTREDAVGTNDLTDNNTVGYATGLITNSARFVSNNLEYLSLPAPNLIFSNTSWTMACLAKFYTTNNNSGVWGKASGSPSRSAYMLRTAAFLRLVLYTNGTSGIVLDTSGPVGQPTTNEWHSIVAMSDTNALKFYIFVNVQNVVTGSMTTIPFMANNAPFNIGRDPANDRYSDGEIDEAAFWNRALTFQEVTNLWTNWMNGVSYPFTGAP